MVLYVNQLYFGWENGIAETRRNPPLAKAVFREDFRIGAVDLNLLWFEEERSGLRMPSLNAL
jgi:hypothetical protein